MNRDNNALKDKMTECNIKEMEEIWEQEKARLLKLKKEKSTRLSKKIKAKYSSKLTSLENEIYHKKNDEKSRMAQIKEDIRNSQERLDGLGIINFISRKSIGELINKQKLELSQIKSDISQIEADYEKSKSEIENCIKTEIRVMKDVLEDEFWIRENPATILNRKQEIAGCYDRIKNGEYDDNDLETVVYDILRKKYDFMTTSQILNEIPSGLCSTPQVLSVLSELIKERRVTKKENGGKALFVIVDDKVECSEASLLDYETRRNRIEIKRAECEKECFRDQKCINVYQIIKNNEIAMQGEEIASELGTVGLSQITSQLEKLVKYGLIRKIKMDDKVYYIQEQVFHI